MDGDFMNIVLFLRKKMLGAISDKNGFNWDELQENLLEAIKKGPLDSIELKGVEVSTLGTKLTLAK